MGEDGCITYDLTRCAAVLDTVRRGVEVIRRVRDGLKATIDRALGALERHETTEQKARRTQRAAVQACDVARATLTTRDDFAFRDLSDLERPTPASPRARSAHASTRRWGPDGRSGSQNTVRGALATLGRAWHLRAVSRR